MATALRSVMDQRHCGLAMRGCLGILGVRCAGRL